MKPTAIRHAGSNPFRTQLKMTYALPRTGWARLSVVDVHGRQLAILADAEKGSGVHPITWNGRDRAGLDCPAGIYFVWLAIGNSVTAERVLRLK